jgi:hypothetical protein
MAVVTDEPAPAELTYQFAPSLNLQVGVPPGDFHHFGE